MQVETEIENKESIELINQKKALFFLNKCYINCNSIDALDGFIISRDILISNELYNSIKKDINTLKSILHSSLNTSVQKTAQANQKWPLINLIRQLLKYYNYNLSPKRVADGYTKDGKKKYKRFFEIKKIDKCNNFNLQSKQDNLEDNLKNNIKVINIT
jgi:hypothetical protein